MSHRRSVALLGGSFCPVHAGHIMVASYISQFCPLVDEVWLVPAAVNPLKAGSRYRLTDAQRLELLRRAVEGYDRIRVCDVELHMPVPSYTIDTLRRLSADCPDCRFRWIIGSDNWLLKDSWRMVDRIISDYGMIVYPRPGYGIDPQALPDNVDYVDAPQIELSSTFIRQGLDSGRNMQAFLPQGVWQPLRSMWHSKD